MSHAERLFEITAEPLPDDTSSTRPISLIHVATEITERYEDLAERGSLSMESAEELLRRRMEQLARFKEAMGEAGTRGVVQFSHKPKKHRPR